MAIRHALLVAVALASFASVAGANGGGNRPAGSPGATVGAHLVFTSNRDGDEDVYAADTNGRVAALTRNRVPDREVVVSKNGRWIALQRALGKLVLLSGDGRSERKLGEGTPVAFSPNSQLLAYTSGRMFVVGVPRGRPRALGSGYPIAFSPSGRLLAFSTYSDALGVMDVITARRTIVPGSQFQYFFGWSPDSRRIALRRSQEEGGNEIETLLVANVRRPASTPAALVRGESVAAEWLTSTRLGFERDPGGDRECEAGVISPSGGSRRTFGPVACFSVRWSPRGDRVAYERRLSEQTSEIVLARADGSASKVAYQGEIGGGEWSPRGRWLLVTAGDELLIVRRDGRRLVRLARGRFAFSEAGSWSPDERNLGLAIDGGLGIVSVAQRKLRRIWSGTVGNTNAPQWVAGPLPRRAPTAAPAPRTEVAEAHLLRSRGVVYELGADGSRVAALLGRSRVDCDRLVAWTEGTPRVIRFSRPAPCGDFTTWDFDVTLDGTSIHWKRFFCGNYCYVAGCIADIRQPYRDLCDGGDEVPGRPPRPPPRAETRRGVSVATNGGTIELRRQADGRVRTIHPPGGAVDAELEDEGLFYAFNLRHHAMPGRIVFIPFESLFQ